MLSLFIDTHDKDIVLALYQNGILLDKNIKTSERNHSDYTMPMIQELLVKNNITIHDINEILVINGPGSFTGVRLGVTIAKTLAYTLNIPIKSMTSLEMYALGYKSDIDKLVSINDVKGVFAGLFSNDNKLIGDLFYKSNEEYEKYIKENNLEENIVNEKNIDFELIYKQFESKEELIAHNVNPIYIKVIEALKND